MEILLAFTLLTIKHFIVDFPLQGPYQWKNKGTYGHPGGILHAGLHGIGTFLCFVWLVVTPVALMFGILDMIIHYHVDWAKMNINAKYGWRPDHHPEFWWLLGIDQFLHTMTYIFLIFILL